MTLTISSQAFWKCPSTKIYLSFISWFGRSWGCVKEDHKGKVLFSSHIPRWLITTEADLDYLAEGVLGFSTVKILSHFHTVLFGRKSVCTAPPLRSEGLCSPGLKLGVYLHISQRSRTWLSNKTTAAICIYYLEFCMDLSLLSHLIAQFFFFNITYVVMDIYIWGLYSTWFGC